jgi:hypothetical protein
MSANDSPHGARLYESIAKHALHNRTIRVTPSDSANA